MSALKMLTMCENILIRAIVNSNLYNAINRLYLSGVWLLILKGYSACVSLMPLWLIKIMTICWYMFVFLTIALLLEMTSVQMPDSVCSNNAGFPLSSLYLSSSELNSSFDKLSWSSNFIFVVLPVHKSISGKQTHILSNDIHWLF